MKPKLLPNAGRVLRRAWSIRLIVVAGILSGCEVALPIIDQFVTQVPLSFPTALRLSKSVCE